MPIKLQVVKEGTSEPADYLFEQDVITIGRGSDNDLTLPDQKISKQHAEIHDNGGNYELIDCGSKNHTFVDGRRVGEDEPYALTSGTVFTVGDFEVEFVPLFMPSSEQTAFADPEAEEENPFQKHAQQLTDAIEGLMETYRYAPSDDRDEAFQEAVESRFPDDAGDHAVLQRIAALIGGGSGDGARQSAKGDASSSQTASPQDTSPQEASSQAPSVQDEAADRVLDAVLESVARMISIPTHFWREFSGNTVVHPPKTAFIHRASVESLRDHLMDPDLSDEEREERLETLREAVNTLVAHNVAMLAGYKKAVMAGSKDLLQKVNPVEAVEEADSGGGISGLFGGGSKKSGSELRKLNDRWQELFHGEWGKLEKDLFRPTYIEAYLDRMAKAWDVDKSEIVETK